MKNCNQIINDLETLGKMMIDFRHKIVFIRASNLLTEHEKIAKARMACREISVGLSLSIDEIKKWLEEARHGNDKPVVGASVDVQNKNVSSDGGLR